MSKLFTIAGTSVLNNINTFRFATGEMKKRVWVLDHNGHTNISLHDLPGSGMTKEDAIVWLQSNGLCALDTVLPNAKKVADMITVTPVLPVLPAVVDDSMTSDEAPGGFVQDAEDAIAEMPKAAPTVEAEAPVVEKKLTFGERMAAMKAAKKAALEAGEG